MFFVLLLPALVLLGAVLVVGPALLPFAVVGAIAVIVYRVVARHHRADHTVRTH